MALAIFFTSLVQRLSKRLASQATSKAKQELQELETKMKEIFAMLEDAVDISDKSEQLRLAELKGVAYDAQDAIDEYEYEVLRAKVEARRQALASHMLDTGHTDEVMFNLDFYHPEVSISDDLAFRVKEIRKRFEYITNEWKRFNLGERYGKRRCVKKWKPTVTSGCYNENETFGREDEKEKIIEWLLQRETGPNGCKLSVLPIVGMGGLGKTTLAQMVYMDSRVCQHFDVQGWICVSEDFNVDNLMKRICSSFHLATDYNMSLDTTFETLKENLNGKEFFLVLDNVWNQSSEIWNTIKTLLVNVGAGKILVTTRNEHVANIMQTTAPIKLGILSFDECWSLFSRIAIESRKGTHSFFSDIGKKIVVKCAGLPLAVKMLANVLRGEDEDTWVDLLENNLWESDKDKDEILPALKLSYDHMPTELRPCFMYLSLFPKNYPFENQMIVQQWMAHGFLEGEKTKEDIGNDYFNELRHRSILHYNDINNHFEMHDLIHDLAQDVAKEEHLLISVDKLPTRIPQTIRHLSVLVNENSKIDDLKLVIESNLRLRTFLLLSFMGYPVNDLMPKLMNNLMGLRTLRFEAVQHPGMYEKSIPDEIINLDFVGTLKHLRYLGIWSPKSISSNISESVYKLYHLQTLDLGGQVIDLSRSQAFGDLVNLRHFDGHPVFGLTHDVVGLTNLATMEMFVVGDGTSQCKVRHLKDLVNLRGRLQVWGLNHVDPSDFNPCDTFLKTRTQIEVLELCWYDIDINDKVVCDKRLAEKVLDYLQPHPNIRGFIIIGYPSPILPAWLGSLSKLECLSLERCTFASVPTLGQLPSLKLLELSRLEGVRSVGREFLRSSIPGVVERNCFSLLRKLEFREMEEWEEWDGVEDTDFPCLQELMLIDCPKLRMLPSLPSVKALDISSCPELRLTSLPSLTKLELSQEWNPDVLSCGCFLMLQHLEISFYRGELVFPDNQSLLSVQNLAIWACSDLRSIAGLGNFTSLQYLLMTDCPNLQISPNERVPPNLQPAYINESPGAEKWY